MIDLKDYIVEVGGIEYVPLNIAQQALEEAYRYEEYQAKLDKAMNEFKSALNNINSITKDIND
jgi:glutamate dehydrogenase/leucine dehydrogenase